MQYYDALGLAPKLSLDPGDLKKRFYERSREWHPDRFARRSPDEQKKALDMTALLNDAFRTLRDPVSRVEYFLEQNHLPPTKTPPPELLEEVFELNIALEELREGDESARSQLADAQKRFFEMRREIDEELTALFIKFDASEEGAAVVTMHTSPGTFYCALQILPEIRASLDRRRYISNLLRDVDKELHVQLSN
jgi:molecular chaperone HscB